MLRFKAFTVLEMMISITISALVISLVFKAFTNTKSISSKVKKAIDEKEERDAFLSTFQYDIYKSQFISYKDNTYVFEIGQSSIIYSFYPDLIIRHHSELDSFKVKDVLIQHLEDSIGLLNSISIAVTFNEDILQYEFEKEYSGTDKLNWERIKH